MNEPKYGTWQPIGMMPLENKSEVIVWADGTCWIACRQGDGWSAYGLGPITPTHWMPLPIEPDDEA